MENNIKTFENNNRVETTGLTHLEALGALEH